MLQWLLSESIQNFDDVKFDAASLIAKLYQEQNQSVMAKQVLRKALQLSQHNVYWHCRLLFQLAVSWRLLSLPCWPYVGSLLKSNNEKILCFVLFHSNCTLRIRNTGLRRNSWHWVLSQPTRRTQLMSKYYFFWAVQWFYWSIVSWTRCWAYSRKQATSSKTPYKIYISKNTSKSSI